MPSDTQDRGQTAAQEIGRALRQARLTDGEQIADIAERLRIRADYLDALEEGELERIPARAYALGFLRSYGSYLGFDGSALVAHLKSAAAVSGTPARHFREPIAMLRRDRVRLKLLAILLLGPTAYAGYLIASGLTDRAALLPGVPPEQVQVTAAPSSASDHVDPAPPSNPPSDASSGSVTAATQSSHDDAASPSPAKPIQASSAPGEPSAPQDSRNIAAIPSPLGVPQAPAQTAATVLPLNAGNTPPPEREGAEEPPARIGPAASEELALPSENGGAAGGPLVPVPPPRPEISASPHPEDNNQETATLQPSPMSAAGRFALQVAAVHNQAAVPGEWQRLVRRYPSLAGLKPQAPKVVDIPGRGTFYRVLGGAFATRAEAQSVCERLRGEGGECRVVPF